MKIVFMAYDKPNYFGGPITNARRLLPELVKRGHQVHALIFYRDYAPSVNYLQNQGVNCHLFPWSFYTEKYIKWILKKVKQIKPDIFVPNIFVSGYYASKWIREAGIPTIAAHRSDDSYHWGMVEEFVIGKPEWAVSGLVCVSQYLHDKVQRMQPQHTQLCVIPSGVPIPQNSSQQTGTLKIAYVGRLVQKQKRIGEVLASLIKVMQSLPDVTATFIGEGEQSTDLQTQVKQANLSHRIYFLGAIEPQNLHQELINYHVLILLSDYEGTPGSVMDGMACGLIPVCLNISGGVQELVIHEKTGILVENREKDLIKAITRLSQNKELRNQLSQQAREHIISHFSLEVAANRWENFAQTLIEKAGKHSEIIIPKKIKLPPVNSGLAREDKRQKPFPLFIADEIYRWTKSSKNRTIHLLRSINNA